MSDPRAPHAPPTYGGIEAAFCLEAAMRPVYRELRRNAGREDTLLAAFEYVTLRLLFQRGIIREGPFCRFDGPRSVHVGGCSVRSLTIFLAAISCLFTAAAHATLFTCTFRSNSSVVSTCSIDTDAVRPCVYTFGPNLVASCTIILSTSQSICGFTAPDGSSSGGQTQTPGASFGAQYRANATTSDYTVFCQ